MVEMEMVSVIRNKKYLLKEINWSIEKGEHWCLFGLNGSGKTTLLNIINGYVYPTKGKVTVLGNEFGKTSIPDLRKEIGIVSSSIKHEFHINHSVLSIVLSGKFASIGLYEAVEQGDVDLARSLMELLNCLHLEDEEYGVLSQGEKQRVLIARALMSQPKILILDEPCNGLDIIAREELLQFIEKVANQEDGPTLIYVSHHVEEVLPCFTHSLLLKKGEVYTKGLTRQVFNEVTLSEFFDREVSVQLENEKTWIALK
ncbi:putative ABC transporter ATP-binding protein YlmA [Lysinibacillus sp. PLM2]|nr:putative ABC transporter ATP-binding protein YlmA [Lysinibacillus sp. PLM2]